MAGCVIIGIIIGIIGWSILDNINEIIGAILVFIGVGLVELFPIDFLLTGEAGFWSWVFALGGEIFILWFVWVLGEVNEASSITKIYSIIGTICLLIGLVLFFQGVELSKGIIKGTSDSNFFCLLFLSIALYFIIGYLDIIFNDIIFDD